MISLLFYIVGGALLVPLMFEVCVAVIEVCVAVIEVMLSNSSNSSNSSDELKRIDFKIKRG